MHMPSAVPFPRPLFAEGIGDPHRILEPSQRRAHLTQVSRNRHANGKLASDGARRLDPIYLGHKVLRRPTSCPPDIEKPGEKTLDFVFPQIIIV
jgi:hypothetical protein